MTTSGQSKLAAECLPFFGLKDDPFSLEPDPRFLFAGASHSAALAEVAYAIERREPLVVVTGEVGTGKTLLCRTAAQRLPRKTFLSFVDDPRLARDDLLKALLHDFGVISKDRTRLVEPSRHELIETLHAFLRSLTPLRAHAVAMIDDAHHLQPDILEQIRLLSNVDDERGTLLQMILVGETDLEPLLSRPELRQLQQRVSRRIQLEPLHRAEVNEYVARRLVLARDGSPPERLAGAGELAPGAAGSQGTSRVEFAPDALQLIAELSGGLPRVINLLCARSLAEACASRLRLIDRPLIQAAALALGVGAGGGRFRREAAARGTDTAHEESFWSVGRSTAATSERIFEDADEAAAVVLQPQSGVPSRQTRYLTVAVPFTLAAVAAWFVVRPARRPVVQAPAPAAAAAPAPLAPGSRSDSPRPGATAPGSNAAPPAGSSEPLGAIALSTPAVGGHFDILVASFRTDARAASVAAEVAALGLPIRRRVSDGWHQVISGPFASRLDAEAAQLRLSRSGHADTRIVTTDR